MVLEFNMSEVVQMSSQQLLNTAHKITATPSLITLVISVIIIFLFPVIFISGSKSKKKYLLLWLVCSITSIIIASVLIFFPNMMHEFYTTIGGIFT